MQPLVMPAALQTTGPLVAPNMNNGDAASLFVLFIRKFPDIFTVCNDLMFVFYSDVRVFFLLV
jgi:hypothetical protein